MKCSGIKIVRLRITPDFVRFDLVCRGMKDLIKEVPYSPFEKYEEEAKRLRDKLGADRWEYWGK